MSIFNLAIKEEKQKFEDHVLKLYDKNGLIEVVEKRKTTSSLQKRALHKFFAFISDALNEIGHEYIMPLNMIGDEISIKFTPVLVKETLWRPIQMCEFGIESTTDIDTHQMNEINDIIIKYFGDRGYTISFPSIQSLLLKEDYEMFSKSMQSQVK